MRRLIAVCAATVACASPGMPPGGPPDIAAPQLLAIVPDSGRTGVTPKEVIFRFDEVVSERPPAATTLTDLFLISPRDGSPNVSWHRDEISVRPRRGWRPNTAYTVTMLRGIADIRGNVRNEGAVTFFSTGSTIPHTRITGHVFDWVAGTVSAGSLVEAFVRPDTVHTYIAAADSNGAFALERMPAGRYTVRAFTDKNKNQSLDPGEAWDSVSVALSDSINSDLLVFVHDTVAPRIRDVGLQDSVTIAVGFDKPIDPAQTLSVANFAVIGPDSAPVPIASVGVPPKDTTARAATTISQAVPAPAPSGSPLSRAPAASRRDTTTKAVKAVMPKPIPIQSVVIKLQRPLPPKTVYRVRALAIRGLLGVSGDSDRGFTTPTPPPPRTTPGANPAQPVTPPPIAPHLIP